MTSQTTTATTPLTPSELSDSLQIFTVKPQVRFSVQTLRTFLTTPEQILFFGKVYKLNPQQLGELFRLILNTTLADALFGEAELHSSELQDYIVDVVGEVRAGEVRFVDEPPAGVILPEVWRQLEVEVAASIEKVAAKLESVVSRLPGKQASMIFQSMMVLNAKRPTLLGDYQAVIDRPRLQPNLLILDVSGSMTEHTIRTIIDDVVALSYQADAWLAIVSDTAAVWEPGSYDAEAVLEASEFCGTHYEELVPLFNQEWGTVITVADYDSSLSAKDYIRDHCSGSIEQVLDISLVNRPTFLAECAGQLASKVQPLLIGNSAYVLR